MLTSEKIQAKAEKIQANVKRYMLTSEKIQAKTEKIQAKFIQANEI